MAIASGGGSCEDIADHLIANGVTILESNLKALESSPTNADRIRATSDEELAEWIEADGWGCEDCLECKRGAFDTCDMMCKEHCLEWLQQPAEGVDHV